MKKLAKRLLALVLAAALAGGGVYGARYWKSTHAATVNVYDITEISETDYWEDQTETYGTVTTDRVQTVFVSGTQQVEEVKVLEGQAVKKGDVLMTYDTTLSQIEVEKAQLEIQQLEQTLKKYQDNLEKVKKYRPGKAVKQKDQVEVDGYTPSSDFDTGSGDDMDAGDVIPGVRQAAAADGAKVLTAAGARALAGVMFQVMEADVEENAEEDGAEPETLSENQKAADKVLAMIAEIKEINDKKTEDEPEVDLTKKKTRKKLEEARAAYKDLTKKQKKLVKNAEGVNYRTLVELEAKYMNQRIAKLGEITSLEQEEDVAKVRKIYDKMSKDVREATDDTKEKNLLVNEEPLKAAEKAIQVLKESSEAEKAAEEEAKKAAEEEEAAKSAEGEGEANAEEPVKLSAKKAALTAGNDGETTTEEAKTTTEEVKTTTEEVKTTTEEAKTTTEAAESTTEAAESTTASEETTTASEETTTASSETNATETTAAETTATETTATETTAAETTAAETTAESAISPEAKSVTDQINALGEVTLDSQAAIQAARAAYNALTDEQKKEVANLAALEAAEEKLVTLMIDNIRTTTKDARAAYDALSDEQKARITNYPVLEAVEKTLESLDETTAAETSAVETSSSEESSQAGNEYPKLESGEGTKESPYVYTWGRRCTFDQEFLAYLAQGKNKAYVTIQFKDNHGNLIGSLTICIVKRVNGTVAPAGAASESETGGDGAADPTESGENAVEVPESEASGESADPTESGESTEQETTEYVFDLIKVNYGEESYEFVEESSTEESTEAGSEEMPVVPGGGGGFPGMGGGSTSVTYTANEIAEMRNTLEESLRDIDLDLRRAKLDYEKKKKELDNGAVLSEIDGIVRTVRDADTARMENQALIEVSGGGGYYIIGNVSELELGSVAVGQTVEVMSFDTGMSYEGEVEDVSIYPQSGSYYDGSGNSNVSYYPFRVLVSEEASLQNGEFVQLKYSAADQQTDSFYLMNSMIRSENGKNYVYVRGRDGLLKKQAVKTGKVIWGSYTEILSGLTLDTWLAFPYGKDVKEGCKTQEASSDELWSYDY